MNEILIRIKAAINVLRGRPTMVYMSVVGKVDCHKTPIKESVIYGNTFYMELDDK